MNMSCEAIRSRVIGNFPNPNVNYPISFARNVYSDYELQELQLFVSYSAENHFCYTVDSKSPPEFHEQMGSLEARLPNVYINQEKHEMDSAGHNQNVAHMECLKILQGNGSWHYVLLLQNNDIILHTNAELAAIFKSLNGANLIKTADLAGDKINNTFQWDTTTLEIFTENTPLNETERQTAKVEFSSGFVESCVTREAVDWMLNQVNLTKFVEQLNTYSYGVDEQFVSTLQNSETFKMPGGYHSACLKKKKPVESITRIAPQYISLNKMIPDVDYAAISCIAEKLFNRSHFHQPLQYDKEFFANLPLVKYQTIKAEPDFNLQTYQC